MADDLRQRQGEKRADYLVRIREMQSTGAAPGHRPVRRRKHRRDCGGPSYMHDSGPGFFRDPDGMDRDNLGYSGD